MQHGLIKRLLYALLNDSIAQITLLPGQTVATKGQLVQPLDLVTRSISDRKPGRVPYVFCHGRLPVPEASRPVSLQSTDKLVYSESQYLELSQRLSHGSHPLSWTYAVPVRCSSSGFHYLIRICDDGYHHFTDFVSKRLRKFRRGCFFSQHLWMKKRPGSSAEANGLNQLLHISVFVSSG